MKKKSSSNRVVRNRTVLGQLVDLIPPFLVSKLARECKVDERSRTFSPWSHVVALVYAQLNHCLSLNDVCDGLRLMAGPLLGLRGATPPSRNALSHANKVREAGMAQKLFWAVVGHLQSQHPGFAQGRSRGMAWRFRRTIHALDATVIQLVASCLDWAEHNHRKAAAKVHVRLSLRTLLPTFAVVGSAKESEQSRAQQLCAGLRAGEIALFDKGYHQLWHFHELTSRGVFFVTRPKEDLQLRVVRRRPSCPDARILRDDEVVAVTEQSRSAYPARLRRVTARVEVDGEEVVMVFLTNNFKWSASSVADLYRCRWQIETFFKQIKQTLQLADFLGNSANAVQWQVWIALLVYVLLRFQAWCSQWPHAFSRLLTFLRAALWLRRDIRTLLERYGTAPGRFAFLDGPVQSWLPGFAR